jgi:ubiquinone/menaquinone biosynthesis C-methylase UbiE
MSWMNEENRILEEYAKRDARLPLHDWRTNIYHPRHPIGHLLQEHNHDILVDALNHLNVALPALKILDVGCGDGSWLRYLVELGADPGNCVGVDLSEHRIGAAKHRNPAIAWHRHNIAQLPFRDDSFDLVLQSVVFSSILDPQMRSSCAHEMQRVTRDMGKILWIDLVRTTAKQLVSFSEADVRSFFPALSVIYTKHVQPAYFRRLTGKYAWIAKSIYSLTKYRCDSLLMVFHKDSTINTSIHDT